MPDLPQIVIPSLLYQALLSGLSAALSWHLLSMATAWLKQRHERQDG